MPSAMSQRRQLACRVCVLVYRRTLNMEFAPGFIPASSQVACAARRGDRGAVLCRASGGSEAGWCVIICSSALAFGKVIGEGGRQRGKCDGMD